MKGVVSATSTGPMHIPLPVPLPPTTTPFQSTDIPLPVKRATEAIIIAGVTKTIELALQLWKEHRQKKVDTLEAMKGRLYSLQQEINDLQRQLPPKEQTDAPRS